MNSLGRTPKITHFALLASVCQNHVATGVLLVLGTNTTSNLNTHAPTTAETTRKPAIQRGRLGRVWGAVRPPPPGNQEILRNTSSEHQNAPQFHQQRSLVRAMLATRKSWRKQNFTQGPRGGQTGYQGRSNLLYPATNSKQEHLANCTRTTQNFTQTLL
jgi:hypothetical protein